MEYIKKKQNALKEGLTKRWIKQNQGGKIKFGTEYKVRIRKRIQKMNVFVESI